MITAENTTKVYGLKFKTDAARAGLEKGHFPGTLETTLGDGSALRMVSVNPRSGVVTYTQESTWIAVEINS